MVVELKIPEVGESITEVEIGDWLKRNGDKVTKDEPLVTLESEKATVELPSPVSGRITQVLREKGQTAKIGEVIAQLEGDGHGAADERAQSKDPAKTAAPAETSSKAAPAATAPAARVMPAARQLMEERGLGSQEVTATGPGGRILKEDVLRAQKKEAPAVTNKTSAPSSQSAPPTPSIRSAPNAT